MGNIVNPVSFRVGWSKYWKSVWSSNVLLFNRYMYHQDYLIYKYFLFLTTKFNFLRNTFFLYDIRLLRRQNVLYVFIYFFDRLFEDFSKEQHWWFKDLRKVLKVIPLQKEFNVFFNFFVHQLVTKFFLRNFRFYLIKLLSSNIFSGQLCIKFIARSVEYCDPLLLAWYIRLKLKQRYSFLRVSKSLFSFFQRKLKRLYLIKGMKIQCAGRLSRKERASYYWHSKGKLSSTTVKANVNYAMVLVFLQNSVAAIKVWVSYNEKYTRSKNYLVI